MTTCWIVNGRKGLIRRRKILRPAKLQPNVGRLHPPRPRRTASQSGDSDGVTARPFSGQRCVLKTRFLEKARLLLPPVASDAYLRLGFASLLAAFSAVARPRRSSGNYGGLKSRPCKLPASVTVSKYTLGRHASRTVGIQLVTPRRRARRPRGAESIGFRGWAR